MVRLTPVPFTQVRIEDCFWLPRQEANRKASLAQSLDMLEKSGNIRNLELAKDGATEGFAGPCFMDSDIYKVLEAVSFSLATHPDPELEARVDWVIEKLAAAQMEDGYLDTHYQIGALDKRWTNLRDRHEMYCAGHMFEAAVAHFQATGKRSLLGIATKFADHIEARFGDGPGKLEGYCGHPEVELALVKLWQITGERRYFELARHFVSNRGKRWFATEHGTPNEEYDGTYWQDQVPIRDIDTIHGHAVRAGYLLSAATDVVAETGDEGLRKMLDRVWKNAVGKRMYVTGGTGSSGSNEGFTADYDLPNLTAYQETCASISMLMWEHRLTALYGDAKYMDFAELALYNGILAGISLDGTRFFYDNPLASKGTHHRSEWFGCACCPPNISRILASLGGYIYMTSPDALWVNLFVQGSVKADVGGQVVEVSVKANYPWEGTVEFTSTTEGEYGLCLRAPSWCEAYTVSFNGRAIPDPAVDKGYIEVRRAWKPGDVVLLSLEMPVRRIEANPRVAEDLGRLAIGRGPLVYCLEGCDHNDHVRAICLPVNAQLEEKFVPELLEGVVVIKGEGWVRTEKDWNGGLYRKAETLQPTPVTAVPYYAWDNRAPGEMAVWIPTAPLPALVGGPELRASVSVSYASPWAAPYGVNDGVEPVNEPTPPHTLCHFWPHKGGQEWIQYTWKAPELIIGAEVYWLSGAVRDELAEPQAWRLEYRNGTSWKPITLPEGYPVVKDGWCRVGFPPVKTTALRLVIEMPEDSAVGVHEWKVMKAEADA